MVPPPPPLRAATAPTCYHNSHGHPRGSTTPLTTYHWLWPLSTPQVGIYLCPGGGKHTTTSQGLVWFRAMHVVVCFLPKVVPFGEISVYRSDPRHVAKLTSRSDGLDVVSTARKRRWAEF